MSLAGNSRLEAALSELWDQIKRARHVAQAKPDRLAQTVDEHIDILETIASGDESASARTVRLHVRNSMRSILEPSSS